MSRTAIDELKQSVHALSQAVADFRANAVDHETVARIAGDVVRQNGRLAGRTGYRPDDDDGGSWNIPPKLDGKNRAAEIHLRPAAQVAPLIRRSESDVRHFQETADNLVLLSLAMKQDPRDLDYYTDAYLPAMQAALDSTTAAEGDEFVPTGLSATLIERVQAELQVAALFPMVEMPTNPFDIAALAVNRARTGKHEQTGDTGQTGFKKITPATRKVTLSAVKFAVEVIFSKELDEDSFIPILPYLQAELVDYLAGDVEDCIINGDAQGAHQDSDVTASDDPRKNFDGLRALAIAAAKTDASSAAALTVAMLRTNRGKMGKYGVRADQIAHIVSINSYIQLLSDSNVLTVDKYGPRATILAGELAKADGAPLVVSEYVRTDLNATGVQDGVTTTETVALTVNRRGFVMGERRGVTIQVLKELYAEYDQDAIAASMRMAFTPRFPAATEKIVALHYNVDS